MSSLQNLAVFVESLPLTVFGSEIEVEDYFAILLGVYPPEEILDLGVFGLGPV